jgi:hypothetical protein
MYPQTTAINIAPGRFALAYCYDYRSEKHTPETILAVKTTRFSDNVARRCRL